MAGAGSHPARERTGRLTLNPLRKGRVFCGPADDPARNACTRNEGKPGGTVLEAAGMVTSVTSLLRSEASGCRSAMPRMAGPRRASAFLGQEQIHSGCVRILKARGFSRAATRRRPPQPIIVDCQPGHQPQSALTTLISDHQHVFTSFRCGTSGTAKLLANGRDGQSTGAFSGLFSAKKHERRKPHVQ